MEEAKRQLYKTLIPSSFCDSHSLYDDFVYLHFTLCMINFFSHTVAPAAFRLDIASLALTILLLSNESCKTENVVYLAKHIIDEEDVDNVAKHLVFREMRKM